MVQSTNQPDPRRWKALALLCGAFFMVILDAAIVVVALPSIEADLGFATQDLQWVLSAYALTFGGLLLLGGRAADLLGRRRGDHDTDGALDRHHDVRGGRGAKQGARDLGLARRHRRHGGLADRRPAH